MSDRWTQLQDLYLAALEADPDDRAALVRDGAGGDDALAAEVFSLLGAESPALLNASAAAAADIREVAQAALDDLAPGTRIGPYRIEAEVGRGGMGAVYRAERADGTFEQTVALKLVKRGMDSDAVLRRFRAERRILARLDHAGIARVIDGGLADDGRPWLAMEFVDGQPITDYADRHGLTVTQRIALFHQVCEAVGYAHRRLVVHRDLKPSNILVTAEGRVKLLDFGIAKVLAGDDDDVMTTLTGPGQLILTPEYAAPEQVAGGPVSTATDVYALGVVLYELLAGQRPYSFDARTPAVIDHVVRTVDPPRPSTVVAEHPPTTGVTADRLRRQLAGDLDTICLTALRKEPERRYTSVEALDDDLHRHRDGLPVLARPDTAGYRARKFVARHRAGLGALAASVAAVALVTALAFAQVRDERDRAEVEADKARQVSAFLSSLFAEANPSRAQGDTLTIYAALDSGAVRVRSDLTDQPAVQAQLLDTIGDTYQVLGRFEEARDAFRDALRLHRTLPQRDPAFEVGVLTGLGGLYSNFGLVDEALPPLKEAVALAREHLDPAAAPYSEALNRLADLYRYREEYPEARPLYEEMLAIRRRHMPGTPSLADGMNNYALFLSAVGDPDAALDMHHEALALRRETLGDRHWHVANSLANLAHTAEAIGRYEDAVAYGREADSLHALVFSRTHDRALNTRRTLAEALVRLGRLAEAEPLVHEVMEHTPTPGPNEASHARALVILSQIRRQQGRFDEAEAHAAEGQRIYTRAGGPESHGVARALAERSQVALARGDTTAARALATQARDLYLIKLEPGHYRLRVPEAVLAATEKG